MINYIKAELYRSFNRIYYWNFVVIMCLLAILAIVLAKITDIFADYGLFGLIKIGIQLISVPVFLVVCFIDIITSEENKNLTLKNIVSSGLCRNKIILGKIITSIILSTIAAMIILSIYLGLGGIVLGLGENFSMEILKEFSIRILAAVPLWIGTIAVGTFLVLVFKDNTVFAITYATVFLATGSFIKTLSRIVSEKLIYIHKILITTNLTNLSSDVITNNTLIFAVLVGISYTVLFTIFSILYFNKMELK